MSFYTPAPAKKKIWMTTTNPVNKTLAQSSERIALRLNRSSKLLLQTSVYTSEHCDVNQQDRCNDDPPNLDLMTDS